MTRLPTLLLARLALLWLALAAGAGRAAAPPADIRLPPGVVPQAARLSITLDPAQPRHRGEVEFDLQLAQPARELQIHAKSLRLLQAELRSGAGRWPLQARRLDGERLWLRAARPWPAGRATLRLRFSGRLQEAEVSGLFRQREGGDWYALTQFEPTGARLAFPLFDEPGFKLPWTLTLTVPAGLVAASNAPLRREQPLAGGMKRVQFEPTEPLPSYLLAFAVGPFDVLDAGAAGQQRVPMRFLAPRGRAAEARYAASVTAAVLERLEAYFGMPYPYRKLDSVAIPVTVTFGAMENPGLVTYASRLLLAREGEVTGLFQREYVATAAHELAHQWFGNLVTPAWWDDIWLNESFASWMGDRITDEVMPAWRFDEAFAEARRQAMRSDRLLSARQIRQPVRSDDELANIFDGIAYAKGQSVLAMVEQWLGPQRFRDGVRRHLQRHAQGNATSEDFFASLAGGGGDGGDEAAREVIDILRSFTGQPGVPLLRSRLQCDGGGARLELEQSRLLPVGSAAPAAAPPPAWVLPVTVRTPGGSARRVLREARGTLALPDRDCPAWVQLNAGGQGYYVVAAGPGRLAGLLAQPLPRLERLAALDDAGRLAESGELRADELLQVALGQAGDDDRAVATAAQALLAAVRPWLDDGQRAAYAGLWQRGFGARARALGWAPRAGEPEETQLLRAELVPQVAALGADAVLREDAAARARAWLRDPAALDPSVRDEVLEVAALDGDAALFDALAARLKGATRPLRQGLFGALGSFRDPALQARALALLVDPQVDPREAMRPLMRRATAEAGPRRAALGFVDREYDGLARRLGPEASVFMPLAFRDACSADEAATVEKVFAERSARLPGGALLLRQTLEQIRQCAAVRERQAPALAGVLGAASAAAPSPPALR